jgi:xylulokinase
VETVLAIDLGGSSLRAALVGRDGRILASAQRPHRIAEEADAEGWWAMLVEAVAELPIGDARPRAMIVTGFTRSQVLVDEAGQPVRPAQCFPDTRATAEAAALAGAAKGSWVEMTAFHPLARLAWTRAHDPGAFARARHVLQPKDFLVLRLTGRLASDRISNAWALERRRGLRTLVGFNQAQLDAGMLPDLRDPWDVVGPCVGLPGLAGVPVMCGAMDTWCASLGAGAARAGDAYLIAGTTDAGGVLGDAPTEAEGLVTLPWGIGLFHTGGPSGAGGDCVQWLAELLGQPDAASVVALAERAAPAMAPLLFLPALSGERAPSWAASSRGAFAGLDRSHGPAEMARAVLEGVAFADRDLLGGLAFDRLFLGGGGATSDLWCQIRADVLGCQVLRGSAQPGLVGAALVAWAGLGVYPTLPAALAVLAEDAAVFRPDHGVAARVQRLFEAFKQVQSAAALMAHTLSRF